MTNFLSIPLTGNDNQGNPVGDKSNVLIKASDVSSVFKLVSEVSDNSNTYDDYQIQIHFVKKAKVVTIRHGADPQGASSNTMVEYLQNAILEANQSRDGDTLHVLNPPLNIWYASANYN